MSAALWFFFSFLFYFSLFCCLSFKKFLLQLTDKSVSQPNNDSWFRWKNTVPNTSSGAISLFWLKEGQALEFIEGFLTRQYPVLELNSFSRKRCWDSDRLSSLCTESAKVGSFTPWKLPEVLNQVCFLFFLRASSYTFTSTSLILTPLFQTSASDLSFLICKITLKMSTSWEKYIEYLLVSMRDNDWKETKMQIILSLATGWDLKDEVPKLCCLLPC